MITDEQAQQAQQWMVDNAEAIGKAISLSEYRKEEKKMVFSALFMDAEGTVAEREAIALASERYQLAVKNYCAAVRDEKTIMAMQKAMENNIKVWQTHSSNLRGVK